MLLVVWHPVPPSIHALRDAVLAGFADAGDPLPVRSLAAPDAGPDDVDAARGLVLVTTENFGMVSGLVKDFLERIYPWFEEVPEPQPGPAVPADQQGRQRRHRRRARRHPHRHRAPLEGGAAADRRRPARVTDEHLAHVREQAATLAAGVDAGVF